MVVAGTGHRPDKLGGYGLLPYLKLIEVAAEWLSENNPELVITGMALGWDQAIARACIKLNIPFIASLPFKGQELKWPPSSQKIYNEILTKAKEVKVVSEGEYKPWKMQIRNEWMVNHADSILAMYDGTSGGTHNCITYAQKQGKTIINLYEKYLNYEK